MKGKKSKKKDLREKGYVEIDFYDPNTKRRFKYNLVELLNRRNLSGMELSAVESLTEGLVSDICCMLDIPEPDISLRDGGFLSDTMAAMYSSKDNAIYINENHTGPVWDKLLGILSSLRNIWQLKTDEELYFADYVPRDKTGLAEYNMQFSMVDARAFAHVVVMGYLGMKPLYNGQPWEVIQAIYKRAREIAGPFQDLRRLKKPV